MKKTRGKTKRPVAAAVDSPRGAAVKAPAKIRRYELERYVQAALLEVMRGNKSEHARVAAAKELMSVIYYERDIKAQKKKDRRQRYGANDEVSRLDDESAAIVNEASSLVAEFERAKNSCFIRSPPVGECGKAGPEDPER